MHIQKRFFQFIPIRLLFAGCTILLLLVSMTHIQKERETLAARLSPGIVRLHILADSDRNVDQQIKLEVRNLLIDYLKEQFPENPTKADVLSFLDTRKTEVEEMLNFFLSRRGFPYQAVLQLTHCYFPTRSYGPVTIPCGYYDAARIILGSGSGHNWWCVLYPRFCFTDTACSEIPEESLRLLKKNLTQDDISDLEKTYPELNIDFFLFHIKQTSGRPVISLHRLS